MLVHACLAPSALSEDEVRRTLALRQEMSDAFADQQQTATQVEAAPGTR